MQKFSNSLEEVLQEVNSMEQQKLTYEKLVKAIEFFSQRFSIENMSNYMFEFAIELLDLKNCVLYVNGQEQYVVFKSQKAVIDGLEFAKEQKHDQMVYFHAGLLQLADVISYVDAKIVDYFKPTVGIPIIMDKSLYGMILFDKGELSQDDALIAEALMNLYHLAITNYWNFSRLELNMKNLDSKIFNLFAINQASKALVSELNPAKLVDLSLSVFGELTQSRVTSIFMFDEVSDSYRCMGCSDVYNKIEYRPMVLHYKKDTKLLLKDSKRIKVVVEFEKSEDKESFSELFEESFEYISYYQPRFIINLVNNNNLIGFVTVSQRVNDEKYDQSIFELIESLASSTFVAINNARRIEQIKINKEVAELKVNRLERLNVLVKNMNTAVDLDNLIELTLDTLKISFGYQLSFFASFNEDRFELIKSVGFDIEDKRFVSRDIMEALYQGKTLIRYEIDDIADLLAGIMTDELYDMIQGLIMIPVAIDDVEPILLGIICLMDVQEGVLSSVENILTLETIANHIAPVIKQLSFVEEMKKKYILNYKLIFTTYLAEAIEEAKDTDSELYLIVVKSNEDHVFDHDFAKGFTEISQYSFELDTNHVVLLSRTAKKNESLTAQVSDYVHCVIKYPTDVTNESEIKAIISQFVKNN